MRICSFALLCCLFSQNTFGQNHAPNPSFEEGDAKQPASWTNTGAATTTWVGNLSRTGKRSISVSDSGMGDVAGWMTELLIDPSKTYVVSGWVRVANLEPYGSVAGGVLQVLFLNKNGQPIGAPQLSTPVGSEEWSESAIYQLRPPGGATRMRLTAGLEFCKGTAWFDDITVQSKDEALAQTAVIRRPNPQAASEVTFAPNLLANGTMEEGSNNQPTGWTYIGKSEKDWSKEEIDTLYRESRPRFNIGRGRGVWSAELVYAGKRALLNIPIEPPQSKNLQFYGRSPIDGFWLSDPIPCQPGKSYLTGGWIRPGASLVNTLNDGWWFGPLEIRFYDEKGKQLDPAKPVRASHEQRFAGHWIYWATPPWIAPANAKSMRLRFGQEFSAGRGGSGETYADNLAIWELPTEAQPLDQKVVPGDEFWEWFRNTHSKVKPPYMPSPEEAAAYATSRGSVENSVAGNIFREAMEPIPLRVRLTSNIGETRKVRVKLTRYDWLGNASAPIESPELELKGASDATVEVTMPPTHQYGAFYLDGEILEEGVRVGTMAGRYAVLPSLNRPRTAENIWSVTTLFPFYGDNRPSEQEIGELLRIAGFGLSWTNLGGYKESPAFSSTVKEIEWYRSLGIRPILRFNNFPITRPIDTQYFENLGKSVATTFKGKVAAYGNWGVEQSNPRTVQQPVFRPILNGTMLSDLEYDQILVAIHNGIKSVDKETPVLVGNISTDLEAVTLQRLYGKPCEGRFDGAVINAYHSVFGILVRSLAEFDLHGDKHKTVWMEETGQQDSPMAGPDRRYKEADGAKNMVRVWVSMKALLGPRLKAITMWGFCKDNPITMVTPNRQPRPHFVAHAVMADALADAQFVENHSQEGLSIYEWKRSDGPLYTIWTSGSKRPLSFETSAKGLITTDLMGNRTPFTGKGGFVTLTVSESPLFVSGEELSLGKRLESTIEHGTTKMGEPQIRLTLKNNSGQRLRGEIRFNKPLQHEERFDVAGGSSQAFEVPLPGNLPTNQRMSISAECTTTEGGIVVAGARLSFARANKVSTPPSFGGGWDGWQSASVTSIGLNESEVYKGSGLPERNYTGPGDISAKLRCLWNNEFLFLGVEVTDESFCPQPERGPRGFLGDSLDFALQPENKLSRAARSAEYNLYLPEGKQPCLLTRQRPLPAEPLTGWQASVTPSGEKGTVNYQVAIPWRDLGIQSPKAGQTISLAASVNDIDSGEPIGQAADRRSRVRWFGGIHGDKNPEAYGDITLVEP